MLLFVPAVPDFCVLFLFVSVVPDFFELLFFVFELPDCEALPEFVLSVFCDPLCAFTLPDCLELL